MRSVSILMLLALVPLNGCEAEKKMGEARVYYFGDVVPKFDAVQDKFFELSDKMVRGRFQERRAVAKQQMDEWWKNHTTDALSLSLPADNSPAPLTSQPTDFVPMGVVFEWNKARTRRFPVRAETMQAVMEAYAKALAQTAQDEAAWDQLCREYQSIRDPFRKLTTKQEMLEKDYADTQRRMEEFAQHVMTTAIGLGAGVAITAAAL